MMKIKPPVAFGLLAGCILLALLWSANPIAETGFLDDWSYVQTADVFAKTGKIVYNGWATAMLGWEIPWGALFIKLFGSSFTAPRLSTLPLAFGCVVLFNVCAARLGVRPLNAFFGSLTLGLSPLFMPMAVTFMTDMGGLFFLLLCLYLCLRALASKTARGSILWLAAAAGANVLGGTSRQITWLGVLVLVPCTGWILRRRRGVIAAAFVFWCLGLIAIVIAMRWFALQPYSIPEQPFSVNAQAARRIAAQYVKALLVLSLVVLPVLIAWLANVGKLAVRRRQIFLASSLLSGAVLVLLNHHGYFVFPWLLDLLSTQELSSTTNVLPGDHPFFLGSAGQTFLAMLSLISLFALLVDSLPFRGGSRASLQAEPSTRVAAPLSWHATLWLLVPFCLAYLALLAPRAAIAMLLDRYLLGLMPFVLFLLLRLYQENVSPRLPILCYLTLLAFALFSAAGIHDWFSLLRADLAAVTELRKAGVTREQVYAGWESDGAYQIAQRGFVNESRLKLPAGAYQPRPLVPLLAGECILAFSTRAPVITGPYVIVLSPLSCLAPTSYPPVPYQNWKPPLQRQLFIQRVPQSKNPQ